MTLGVKYYLLRTSLVWEVSGDTSHIGTMNPFRYRGYYYDEETGFYYVSSRYYDPETGRFISADTTEILTATPTALTDKNLFAYCDNNPIVRIDTDGQFWNWVIGASVGAVGGAILGGTGNVELANFAS